MLAEAPVVKFMGALRPLDVRKRKLKKWWSPQDNSRCAVVDRWLDLEYHNLITINNRVPHEAKYANN